MRGRINAALVYSQLLCISILGCVGTVKANPAEPDLLTLSKQLECAGSAQQASKILRSFQNIELPGVSLPNEWFGSEHSPSLHAGSLDITLNALALTATNFPELQVEVEAALLQWNYCDVLLDNIFYDIHVDDEKTNKKIADYKSPLEWSGFYQYGFLGEHDARQPIYAYAQFGSPFTYTGINYSELFRGQCLPHPQTSKLFFNVNTYFPWRVVHDEYDRTLKYPYQWQKGCGESPAKLELSSSDKPAVTLVEERVEVASNEVGLESESKPISLPKPDIDIHPDPLVTSVVETSVAMNSPTQEIKPQSNQNSSDVNSVAIKESADVLREFSGSTQSAQTSLVTQTTASESIALINGAATAVLEKRGFADAEKNLAELDSDDTTLDSLNSGIPIPDRGKLKTGSVALVALPPSVLWGLGESDFANAMAALTVSEGRELNHEPPSFVQRQPTNNPSPVHIAPYRLDGFAAEAALGENLEEKLNADEIRNNRRIATDQRNQLLAKRLYGYRYELAKKQESVQPTYRSGPPLGSDVQEQLLARRVYGYRYELSKLYESMLPTIDGPGYRYYNKPSRPIAANNGIPVYITPPKSIIKVADGIPDYIVYVPKRNQLNLEDEISRQVLVASASLSQRWVNQVELSTATYGLRNPSQTVFASGFAVRSSEPADTELDAALTSLPVIVSEDGNAPAVVFEAIPEPKNEGRGKNGTEKNRSVSTKKKRKYRGFNGFFTLGNRSFDADGFSLTAGASYKPIKDSYWFARGSWNYRLNDGEFRYTWGIGYDDWHPGTWSVQLNHWGPLLPGDYLDIDNAIASVTYKFNKNRFMKRNKLASSLTLSQKISGDPVLSWSNSWTPTGKWFIRSTISQPLKGGDLSWSYGFGRTNYAPFSFSFEYNNWGYNKAFQTNFKENANLSFTYRWRY